MSNNLHISDFTLTALRATQGDPTAAWLFVTQATRFAHRWLRARGINQFGDRKDIIQTVLIRFFADWDIKRSSAKTFVIHVLLPTARAKHFRLHAANAREAKVTAGKSRRNSS